MLHINHQQHSIRIILPEHFIDSQVLRLDRITRNIPSDKFLLGIDFLEHIEHGFVVEMVEEPDVGFVGVLLEGDGVAVADFD